MRISKMFFKKRISFSLSRIFFLKRIASFILHQSSRFSLQVLSASGGCGLSATIGANFRGLSLYLAFLYTLLSEFKERFLSIVTDAAKPKIWKSVGKGRHANNKIKMNKKNKNKIETIVR